jgi:DNA-binding CsgD family transcriptional regulator
MTARAWTAAEQRDALRWRLELRMSLGEIAAALGRSEKSVEVALYRMG